MNFIKITYLIIILFAISCSSMKEVELYEFVEKRTKSFEYKDIFIDSDLSGVWGVKQNTCKSISFDTLNNFIGNLFNKVNLRSIEEFENYLITNNLDLTYVKKKINIEIMWNRLIYYKYKSKLKIDTDEIKNKLLNTKKIQSKKYFLQEILFEIKENEKLKERYQKIKNEISNSSFSKAALIYSLSDTSTSNGDVGWINESSLNKNILKKIEKLNMGDISKPITVPGGFLILKIKDTEINESNIDIEKELQKTIQLKTNQQLNQYSLIFYNKIKKDTLINEL